MSIWLGVEESNQHKFIWSVKFPLCNTLLCVKDDTKSISWLALSFLFRQLLLCDRYFWFGCILFFNVFSNTSSDNNCWDPPSRWRSECRCEFVWPFPNLLWACHVLFQKGCQGKELSASQEWRMRILYCGMGCGFCDLFQTIHLWKFLPNIFFFCALILSTFLPHYAALLSLFQVLHHFCGWPWKQLLGFKWNEPKYGFLKLLFQWWNFFLPKYFNSVQVLSYYIFFVCFNRRF